MPRKGINGASGQRSRVNRKKTNNKNKRQNQNRKSPLPMVGVPMLSGCARRYFTALVNPFKIISPPPCIPDLICIPSVKFRTRAIGTLSTNAAGQGLLGVNAYNSWNNNAVAVRHSTSAYIPPIGTDFDLGAIGVAPINVTSPYNLANISSGAQLRLVGCGIRVRYQGTELNRAGRLVLFRSPSNTGYLVGTNSSLLAILTTSVVPVKKEWRSVCYFPDDPDFFGYQTTAALNILTANSANLLITIDGLPTISTFDYEFSAYWEMIGNIFANENFTKSESDVVGMGAALAAVPDKIPDKPSDKIEQKGISDLFDDMTKTASHIAYNVGSRFLQGLVAPQPLLIKEQGAKIEDAD